MNTDEMKAAQAEAHSAVHSLIVSTLYNKTPLGRLNIAEVRAVLHTMAEEGYTITMATSPEDAKAQLAALA